jgi:23S rRNA-/tRNA-specific pseudouridylate synthase
VGALGALGERTGQHRRIVHRLDRDTSGAVMVARTLEAERALREAFEQGRVVKEDLALEEGEHPLADGEQAVIDLPIGPGRKRGGTMRVIDGGKPARTRLRVEQRFRGYTLLVCEPLTGRTHQLRVHLVHEGFPLAVDPDYGRRSALLLSELKAGYRPKPGRPERPLIERLTLHARRVVVQPRPEGEDPAEEPPAPGPEAEAGRPTGLAALSRTIEVSAPVPPDLAKTLKQLAKVRPPRR